MEEILHKSKLVSDKTHGNNEPCFHNFERCLDRLIMWVTHVISGVVAMKEWTFGGIECNPPLQLI
jgi:hypothetical protein